MMRSLLNLMHNEDGNHKFLEWITKVDSYAIEEFDHFEILKNRRFFFDLYKKDYSPKGAFERYLNKL
jgi:hypothetical protein